MKMVSDNGHLRLATTMSIQSNQSRRSFLAKTGAALIAAPFIQRIPRPGRAAKRFDPDFGTAGDAIRALRSGVISARELTDHTYRRIARFNPKINAFITLVEEQAHEQARRADEALARGRSLGRLHGLPIVLKDAFETRGIRTTCDSKSLATYVPNRDAVAVARLRSAGAVFVGKTNLPEFAADVQSYNEVAGTTQNPWDLERTPGGSTGGGAAALAAGFGFLELGSDIGGSIRTPAHFCGVYGHKPSLKLVPLEGHIPPPPGHVVVLEDLPVAGPLARSAADLRLELEVLGGPAEPDSIAYRWTLPAPRRSSLKEYRIGYVLDDPFCPVTPEVKNRLAGAVEALRKSGVHLQEGWPEGIEPATLFDVYLPVLVAYMEPDPEEMKKYRESFNRPWGHYARRVIEGADSSLKDWLGRMTSRRTAQHAWAAYFKTHDAFLMPENFVAAFRHDHKLKFFERYLPTSLGPRLYGDVLKWISIPNLLGLPATVAPVGRTPENLPVGVQIVGPIYEDATPIDIAAKMADVVGGFEAPPGYK